MDIEELYDKIYRFCLYRVYNRELAEDLTQETFLRFLASGYEERGKRLRFLYTIARNLCIEEGRKRDRADLPEDISDDGREAEEVLQSLLVRQALSRLADDEREVLVLRYMNEEPIHEICTITGCSRFSVYRLLKRARKHFKEMM